MAQPPQQGPLREVTFPCHCRPGGGFNAFLWFVHGLNAHRPEKNEPKDGFRIVIKLLPPFAIHGIRRGSYTQFRLFERKFLDSVRVFRSVALWTARYRGDDIPVGWEWHCSSTFNGTRHKERCTLTTLQLRQFIRKDKTPPTVRGIRLCSGSPLPREEFCMVEVDEQHRGFSGIIAKFEAVSVTALSHTSLHTSHAAST